MSDNIATSSHRRSEASLFFEKVVLAAGRAGAIPRLADIDFAALRAYEPFIAIVKPDHETRTLRFNLAGAALSQFVGHDLEGVDYLDLVDPAIKGDAFDSAFLMMSRPCGLWQITPVAVPGGGGMAFEYTGFPVFDHIKGVGQIIFLSQPINIAAGTSPVVGIVRHSTEWCWLEMRDAV